jgi:hypothetical protein
MENNYSGLSREELLALLAFYADRLEDLVYKMFPLDI